MMDFFALRVRVSGNNSGASAVIGGSARLESSRAQSGPFYQSEEGEI
jgi:hypothetical protein